MYYWAIETFLTALPYSSCAIGHVHLLFVEIISFAFKLKFVDGNVLVLNLHSD